MQDLPPLVLHASLSNWRLFYLRMRDKSFQSISDKVLDSNHYSCCFCGFVSHCYLSIINIDGNYLNNNMSNLSAACPFCAQCGFIENVGVSGYGGGALIYMPELSQAELNMLCHVLFASMIYDNVNADSSKSTYRDLKMRSQFIEKNIGQGMSKPATFGQLLLDAPTMRNTKRNKQDYFKDIRLLPTYTRFAVELLNWSKESLGALLTK